MKKKEAGKSGIADSGKQGGGEIAIRGFVIQSLVVLLEICQANCIAIRFEPQGTEKVDFFWLDAEGGLHAVQVKSTTNIFRDAQAKKWAKDLEGDIERYVVDLTKNWVGSLNESQLATEWNIYPKIDFKNIRCHLTLVGTPLSATERKIGEVEVHTKNFDGLKTYLPDTDIWSVVENKIAKLIHHEKGFTGTPAEWRQAIEWAVGKLQCGCNDVMTRDELVENLKRIVITGVPVSDFEKSLASYRQNLIHQLNEQHVIGKKRLSKVFVEQDFYDPPLSSQASGEESPRTNSFKMVEDHPRLFILSEPGMGKSTFLNALALRYAQDVEKPLPILIRLREKLPDMDAIADAIGINHADRSAGKDFIRDMLQAGKALLILDGLDEIKVEEINKIKSSIHDLNPVRCLITCRLSHSSEGAAFESEEHFKRVQMAKFSREQIERFADCWFVEPNDSESFKPIVHTNKNLTELASQPLLLALLCSNFEKTKAFSQISRAAIYKEAIEKLLQEWDTDKEITRKSCFGTSGGIRKKKAILSAVAYENFKANRYTMTKAALKNQIEQLVEDQDGKDVLQEIAAHHGILIKQNDDHYAFLHLTFQEYFTALAIVGNPDYQRELMQHIHDPRWREVFLLTASLLDNADDFFDYFQQEIFVRLRAVPEICELVAWAAKRVEQLGFKQNIAWILRPAYCSFVLDNMFSAIPDCAVDKDKPVTSHFVMALSNLEPLYLPRHIDILRKYSHQLATDYLLQRAYNTPLLQHTGDLHNFPLVSQEKPEETRKFLQEMAELFLLCDEIELSGLMKRASELLQKPEEWQMLASKLRAKLTARLDLTFCVWFEDSEQLGKVLQYIQANHLCLDCLNLATVTDRDAIRNSLFLPPEESASGG